MQFDQPIDTRLRVESTNSDVDGVCSGRVIGKLFRGTRADATIDHGTGDEVKPIRKSPFGP